MHATFSFNIICNTSIYIQYIVIVCGRVRIPRARGGFCGDCLYANFSFVVCDRMLRVVWINKKWVKVLVILLWGFIYFVLFVWIIIALSVWSGALFDSGLLEVVMCWERSLILLQAEWFLLTPLKVKITKEMKKKRM